MHQLIRSFRLHRAIGLFGTLSLVLILFPYAARSQGNLLITPRRVVFEGGKKTTELNVANIGKDTARYVISMMEIRMREDGTFESITEPDSGQNFASKYLRFFPRTVILGPNEAQVIKVQLRNGGKIPEGEYRSHIYFRAVEDKEPLGESPSQPEPGTISVQLKAVFGITIPVIIHSGNVEGRVELSDPKITLLNDTLPKLGFIFTRTGNGSVYGDITVDYLSPQGKTTRVCTAKGVAVYTPNLTRKLNLDLDHSLKINYHKGSLHIVYTSQTDDLKLAEKTIQLE